MAEISPTRGRLHYLEHARDTIYDFIPNWDSSPSKLAHRLLPSSWHQAIKEGSLPLDPGLCLIPTPLWGPCERRLWVSSVQQTCILHLTLSSPSSLEASTLHCLGHYRANERTNQNAATPHTKELHHKSGVWTMTYFWWDHNGVFSGEHWETYSSSWSPG